MAPDLALDKIKALTSTGDVVLDPMCGSGTVPRVAAELDRTAVGCDVDPLAVMITRTISKPAWSDGLERRAQEIIAAALQLDHSMPPWIESDPDSLRFVDFWFAPKQRFALAKLGIALAATPVTDDPLRVALSRLIITKDGGASLARDTSHSRPHRVRLTNEFDVYAEFLLSAKRLESLASSSAVHRNVSVRTVDARQMYFVESGTVDLIVTSPPYLNAIDYLRGHRMSLVWLGWSISQLRSLRGTSIGSSRRPDVEQDIGAELAAAAVPELANLPTNDQAMIRRFAIDMDRLCRSLARVTRAHGHLVLVVADSLLRGIRVSNSNLCQLATNRNGFILTDATVRDIPAKHRYLPPPSGGSGLDARMREEFIFTFERST